MDSWVKELDVQQHILDFTTLFLDAEKMVDQPEIPIDKSGDVKGLLR